MTVAATRLPVIAICGTTGVGKSQLAVELALHLSKTAPNRAKIINADAMQCYAGMDIITNKMPEAQRHGVEHLLMGFKQPGEQYVVGQWVQDSMKAIEETHKQNKIPIVVGGTSYWIQHLLFPNRLSQSELHVPAGPPELSEDVVHNLASLPPELLDLFSSLPDHPPSASDDPTLALSLHKLLSRLDPEMAMRWHWRDTRKVLRNIEIVRETGRIPSLIAGEQSKERVKARYRALCYWLYAEPDVLNPRLDARIDEMIETGLLNEIKEMRRIATAGSNDDTSNRDTDYTLGLYQAIGYKEFHEYLTTQDPSDRLFHESVDSMKHSTRKYAKRQISWLRNKLLPVVNEANTEDFLTPTYVLDATELGESWRSRVLDPALRITDAFLDFRELPDPKGLSSAAARLLNIPRRPVDPISVLQARRKIICQTCTTDPEQPCMIEDGTQWEAHRTTKVHRRLASKGTRVQMQMMMQAEKQAERRMKRKTPQAPGSLGSHLPSVLVK
ncbi:tRNA isopentenyltransferase [Pleurotus eryngii]|uniref:tRNA isopentenyltransferase n=1 Tax=Pleurotus eryngii TaxID=5323 RepID=A0A9P5ZNF6_PLEER|nr:tRNA isopentenyltransferase [Pleurotus eryngii]